MFGVLGAWLIAYELHLLAPYTPVHFMFGRYVHDGVLLTAACLCALRAVRQRPERLAWSLIAAALFSWALGEVYYTVVLWDKNPIPVPSPADVGYLGVYPLGFSGLVLLMRARVSDVSPTVWVDGIIAGLVVAALSAAVVFQEVLHTIGGRPISVATNLAYPLGDLLLLAFVVSVFSVRRWRPDRTWALIGAGIVCFWIADSLYLVETAENTYTVGGVFDVGWWLGIVLIAGAAWMSPPRSSSEEPRESTRSIVVPIAFALVGLTLLVVATLLPVNPVAVGLATASLVAVIVRLIVTFRQNVAMLRASRAEALTDALTGLGNRRKLMLVLARRDAYGSDQRPVDLVLFDLDGFKQYNDTFGHPAGDAMLMRLARHFETAVAPYGNAYRMGGDEFCALIGPGERKLESVVAAATEALTDQAEGFSLGCSYGAVHLPGEAASASEALRLADIRLYRDKDERRSTPQDQARGALLQVLQERQPDLHLHLSEVAALARSVGQRLGVAPETLDEVVRAAELHDVGKMAIPDTILNKPTQLNPEEWEFMRSHTLVGERILAAAKALVPVSKLVRSSHERMDGGGYPDGLEGAHPPRFAHHLRLRRVQRHHEQAPRCRRPRFWRGAGRTPRLRGQPVRPSGGRRPLRRRCRLRRAPAGDPGGLAHLTIVVSCAVRRQRRDHTVGSDRPTVRFSLVPVKPPGRPTRDNSRRRARPDVHQRDDRTT